MSHTSRGLTPPNGPSGASGNIGRPMNVIASNTTAERNSGHVIFSAFEPDQEANAERDAEAGN